MTLGRPVNKDTQNKIIVHTIGDHRYASTKVYTVGADGKKHYSYKHWGTLVDGDRFHPGTNYFYAPVAERNKLIFPSTWDMSEVSELSSTRRRGRVSYQEEDVDRQYGATWLLDKMVNDVLTMAYFPFVDNLSYNQLSQWQKEVKSPSEHELNSVNITRLTQSITEKHRMDLFRCRAKRVGKGELCAVDSTSMSTYGFNLVDIRWGKNKEHLPLRQTLDVVVYSLTSHMPIYYKELPGNMPDCRTIELIMKELEHAGFKNLVLITDRGYESMKNLETYIAKGQKVITSVKVSGSDVLDKIRAIDMTRGFPQGMTIASKDNLYYAQYDMEYSVGGNGNNVINAENYKLNLYYNPSKRGEKICDIRHAVLEQSAELDIMIQANEPVADREDTIKRFNLLNITFNADDTIKSYEVNQKKLDTMLLTAGFFANKTIGVEFDPLQAMNNYGMRDEQEKCFALQKDPLGHDHLRIWSEGGKRGRMFIYFVGLILASYVRSVWQSDEVLHKKFTSTEAVLAEMRTIRCVEHTGRMKFITPFVGSQVDICKAFGFCIPENCAPVYVSKAKSLTRRRGRPAKAKIEKTNQKKYDVSLSG